MVISQPRTAYRFVGICVQEKADTMILLQVGRGWRRVVFAVDIADDIGAAKRVEFGARQGVFIVNGGDRVRQMTVHTTAIFI